MCKKFNSGLISLKIEVFRVIKFLQTAEYSSYILLYEFFPAKSKVLVSRILRNKCLTFDKIDLTLQDTQNQMIQSDCH